ncbi:hypothetical protein P3X46_016379 [Hevea brasiliensis]|uniref:Uncharacterized protein n=2 Tax=Hevea brasiliensis TaxID=3981 RepID=A0A6A6LD42_HEVBR|nr:uncharacterized protein LOC110663407 [Hevea brasiliensis]KAF2299342.1 hypothetical protein GH714_031641 [Hevea brasiliensis]KAJ9173218.1 hypothetical protein P3X46_016379 [Hevea brasiliensis]
MEQVHEKKHVCKLCNKSFLNGRILGGHMKIHVARDSANEQVKLESSNMGIDGYGLRENPKKSWKSSSLNPDDFVSVQESFECKVCGKQFEFPRSLHGHMRHHSAAERKGIRCKECGKGFRTLKSLTGHMRLHAEKNRVSKESRTSSSPNLVVMTLSDTETVSLVRRKRSNRMRYKVTPNSSFSSLNESVPGFEVEEELEEVAMCLMMLSRGVCKWGEFKSIGESLDDDFVYFEAKSLYQNKQMEGRSENGDDVFEDNEPVKKKKPREQKLDPYASDTMNKSSECSECDCDMVCNGEKEIPLEVPIEKFYRGVDSKGRKLEDESGLLLCDTEIEKGIHDEMDSSAAESESSQEFTEEVGLDLAGPENVKCTPSNKPIPEACDTEMGKDSCTEMICSTSDFGTADDTKNKSQFQCRICNKIFPTYQALGGHQTFHRTTKSSVALKIEEHQAGIETNLLAEKFDLANKLVKLECIKDSVQGEVNEVIITSYQSKKRKEHKCHICSKNFVSGQALGGHKRAHHPKAREEQNMTMKQEGLDICNAPDISVTDMLDTEANREVGFESWWAGIRSYKHESLADLIAN